MQQYPPAEKKKHEEILNQNIIDSMVNEARVKQIFIRFLFFALFS